MNLSQRKQDPKQDSFLVSSETSKHQSVVNGIKKAAREGDLCIPC